MARKDRHTLLVGRMALDRFVENAAKAVRRQSSREPFESRKAKCDQYFSSTLWGEDRKPAGTPRYSGRSER